MVAITLQTGAEQRDKKPTFFPDGRFSITCLCIYASSNTSNAPSYFIIRTEASCLLRPGLPTSKKTLLCSPPPRHRLLPPPWRDPEPGWTRRPPHPAPSDCCRGEDASGPQPEQACQGPVALLGGASLRRQASQKT